MKMSDVYFPLSVITATALTCALLLLPSKTNASTSLSFRNFQYQFLTIYLIMTAADWAQGAYVYRLYEHYGFTLAENGQLFIAGFFSSMTLGTLAGSLADKYGRRFGSILYGVIYMASCLTKHFNNFYILMVGRILGGIATSLLFSVFEAWMVAEHERRGFDRKWMSSTFALMSVGNGLVAILSGWISQAAVDTAGHPVAPFDFSFALLALGTAGVWFTWEENYGHTDAKLRDSLLEALSTIRSNKNVLLIGVIQSLFEASMYTFVFIWTPALEQHAKESLPLGTIFATFMICSSLGGALFKWATGGRGLEVRSVMMIVFLGSGIAFTIPALFTTTTPTFCAFLFYEIWVGMFWPAMGTLRSVFVEEHVRSTTLNLFRVPLNALVCVLLLYIGDLPMTVVFGMLAACQGLCAWLLTMITSERPAGRLDAAAIK
eukprot:m.180132 g.180132  ORF g.180132 m.180132 type:complete len:433 (-) comp16610_c0_seq14:1590-2888(-)